MTVAEQVISVFTGVRGYLDDVELNQIKNFETEIIDKIKAEKSEIIDAIQSSGKLEKDVEDTLIQLIEEYKKSKKDA
jgi:F-type H+-transporting ATPase subunit alpha